jgi:hypothetical protein
VEGAANWVPPQSVEVESAALPQEEVDEEVPTPDSAPTFNLAPRIPPLARLTGMQPRVEESHQQATPMKEALLRAAQLYATLVSV